MRSLFIVGTVIILMILAKLFLFPSKEIPKQGSQAPAASKGGTMPVNIFLAKEQNNVNEIYASGSILANEEVDLKSEISGRLVRLNIREGAMVQKGQLIAKLNDADILARLKKIKFEEELAKQIEARQKKLLDINAISKEEYDISVNKVNTLSADKEALEVAYAQTEVRAPFSGKIGLKNISVGAYLTSSITIATLVQTNPLKMDFSIPEKYASRMVTGKKVNFQFEGSKQAHEATILALDPKIDDVLRTLKVRTTFNNASGKFMPGMFVKVNAPIGSTNSIMVPSETIIPFVGGKKMFLLKNGMAEEREVITGLRTENMVEVLEGIGKGDSIVASGFMSIKKGQPIKSKIIINP